MTEAILRRNTVYILAVILFLAAVLRLWNIGMGDPIGDEVLYSFRAVGMMDFDEAEFQTTPLEWFDPDRPWWTRFSFHDHPPMVFFIQYLFMSVFGEHTYAFRVPSALFGVLSVFLIYKITALIFSRISGIASALVLAVTANHVFISRVGLQESYIIFFMLLAFYFFLTSLRDEKKLPYLGAALGLSFLTKYTAGILAPVFVSYWAIWRRDIFTQKRFYAAILFMLLIASPVLVYNIGLYRTVGHFDFQLSFIMGQHPEVWGVAPGKEEIGTVTDRIKNIVPNIVKSNSWLFLFFVVFGLVFLRHRIMWIAIGFLLILFLFIGPTIRFLTVLTPFFSIAIGAVFPLFLDAAKKRNAGVWGAGAVLLFLFFEVAYSVNSGILYDPVGPPVLAYAPAVRNENPNYGFLALEDYLRDETRGRMPAYVLESRYAFIREKQNLDLDRAQKKGLTPYPAIFIYDSNILNGPQLWMLDRLQIYHGWPVIRADDFFSMREERGADFFKRSGFTEYYFIRPVENMPQKKSERLTSFGEELEKMLRERGDVPLYLANGRGEAAFRIYRFDDF